MPAMVRISDDLPAPLAPTIATISPLRHLERHRGQRLRVAVVEIEVLDLDSTQTSVSSPR